MRVLIVEDNSEKLRAISKVVCSVEGVGPADIRHAADVRTARESLRETAFDLLILDIALPARLDQEVTSDAGLELLVDMDAGRVSVPTHVIGMTAHEEVYVRVGEQFSQRLMALLYYDQASTEWSGRLIARVRQILASLKSGAETPRAYEAHVAVVCALEVELEAVLRLPWNWSQLFISGDNALYYRGSYEQDGHVRQVRATCAARKGMPASAVLAAKAAMTFRPRYLAMTGIAAGLRGRVALGDVVIAEACWDYGSGKWSTTGRKATFAAAPYQIALESDLRGRCRQLAANHELMNEIRQGWPNPPPNALRTVLGPLASGAAVIADGRTIDQVKEQHRELLGIEMEAYGVFVAAAEVPAPRPSAVVLKAIVDFADGEKDDSQQHYAAYTSAQALRYLFERYL